MKTAEEYISDEIGLFSVKIPKHLHQAYKTALNKARKEAIEECAKKAKVKQDYLPDDNPPYFYVDKESILSLIKELK